MDEEKINLLNSIADAFGVGTWISNAPVIDFSLDIVEVEGKPLAKKGKRSGKKQVWQCSSCLTHQTLPFERKIEKCSCGGNFTPLLTPAVEEGKIVADSSSPQKIREYVLEQLDKL